MLTQTKLDLKKEDAVMFDLFVADVSTFKSQKGNELISVQLVGSKNHTVFPNMLYFGEQSFADLYELRGQKVNVLFGTGRQGFTVQELQTV